MSLISTYTSPPHTRPNGRQSADTSQNVRYFRLFFFETTQLNRPRIEKNRNGDDPLDSPTVSNPEHLPDPSRSSQSIRNIRPINREGIGALNEGKLRLTRKFPSRRQTPQKHRKPRYRGHPLKYVFQGVQFKSKLW